MPSIEGINLETDMECIPAKRLLYRNKSSQRLGADHTATAYADRQLTFFD